MLAERSRFDKPAVALRGYLEKTFIFPRYMLRCDA